ncbi:hypothetical protein K440DRAFT_278964 [Wilcoxina mikolae CBS 423.85]|nr:hypothetical protein K440DRAFT_278964 [Wilcoxina mikolae CBS 423.85]
MRNLELMIVNQTGCYMVFDLNQKKKKKKEWEKRNNELEGWRWVPFYFFNNLMICMCCSFVFS